MRFSDQFLDEVRQRLPISQVVGEYVIWDKRKSQPGRGDFWACCPFHGEKTPSFHADDRRGHYHCFGCGASGDHFRFITEKTGMHFAEAVEKLAGLAGLPMPARDEREEKRQETRRSLLDVMELATKYFEAALSHNIGARARGYLFERGISVQEQQRFRLGFAPDSRNGLKEHLAENGVSGQDMVDAGLVVARDDSPIPYDRFRNRLIFPIADLRGRVIAFGGRALAADMPAKYLNSPETELFSKRRTLYNGKDARQAAHEGKPLVVVEGYVDVIAAVSAGFEGTLAPLGTALTEEHLNLLWTMHEAPILCFDGDEAGQRAAARAADLVLPLLKPGQTIRVATLPEGLDPDDLIKKHGRAAFADVLDRARALSDVVWAAETGGLVPETPEARAALESRLKAKANSIGEPSVRRHYLQAFEDKLAAFFQPVRAPRFDRPHERGRSSYRSGGRAAAPPRLVISESLRNSRMVKPARVTEASPREAAIVLTLVNHPSLAEERLEQLSALDLESPRLQDLLASLLDLVTKDHDIDRESLVSALSARGFADVLTRLADIVHRQGIWQAEPDTSQIDAATGLGHALALHNKKVQLNRELKVAELALGDVPSEENFQRLRDIQNQITTVDGTEALIEGFGSLSGRATRSF